MGKDCLGFFPGQPGGEADGVFPRSPRLWYRRGLDGKAVSRLGKQLSPAWRSGSEDELSHAYKSAMLVPARTPFWFANAQAIRGVL